MITNDLAPLFAGGQPGVQFRQGTILTWNSATGENTVDLAGGTLTNVPILNTGEAIALKAGHVVGMLGQGLSWFIIGRITPANDPNFAGASVAFGGAGTTLQNFSVTTSQADKITSSIEVPSWVDEAVVLLTVNVSLANTSASPFYCSARAVIDGVGGGGSAFGLGPTGGAAGSANDFNGSAASAQRLITSPGSTISLAGRVWTTSGTVPASGSSTFNLDAIAIFRSTT